MRLTCCKQSVNSVWQQTLLCAPLLSRNAFHSAATGGDGGPQWRRSAAPPH